MVESHIWPNWPNGDTQAIKALVSLGPDMGPWTPLILRVRLRPCTSIWGGKRSQSHLCIREWLLTSLVSGSSSYLIIQGSNSVDATFFPLVLVSCLVEQAVFLCIRALSFVPIYVSQRKLGPNHHKSWASTMFS